MAVAQSHSILFRNRKKRKVGSYFICSEDWDLRLPWPIQKQIIKRIKMSYDYCFTLFLYKVEIPNTATPQPETTVLNSEQTEFLITPTCKSHRNIIVVRLYFCSITGSRQAVTWYVLALPNCFILQRWQYGRNKFVDVYIINTNYDRTICMELPCWRDKSSRFHLLEVVDRRIQSQVGKIWYVVLFFVVYFFHHYFQYTLLLYISVFIH